MALSEAVHGVGGTNAHLMIHTSLACMALARAWHHRKLVCAVLVIFALQIPLLLSSCSAHAIIVVDPPAAAARRRPLPVRTVQAAQSVEVKETVVPHPRSMERTASSSSSSAAFMNAVSKHQVPSGANPDSN